MIRGLRTFAVAAGALSVALTGGQRPARAEPIFDPQEIMRGAVKKSIPLLQTGAASFAGQVDKRCFSCHNQSLPVMALTLAREHGFEIDEDGVRKQVEHVYNVIAAERETVLKASTDPEANRRADLALVDPGISVGYVLAPLAAAKRPGDELTGALTAYLMGKQEKDGHWPVYFSRPPMEGSEFTATALAVRALRAYPPKDRASEVDECITRARQWLVTAAPRTTEDKAFRLFGLRWADADKEEIEKAVRELSAEQRDDGGWAQLPSLPVSDAYATGQVLVALHQAGGLSLTDAVYRRGLGFLIGTQRPDGSWFVQTRTPAVFQPYFEAGFPHEKSQFISIAGTCWATMALSLVFPPTGTTGVATASR